MSIDNTLRKYDQAVNSLGRSGLNIAFPNEFELYVCAFELVNTKRETISYFIFPIMPTSISERIPQINTIKRTNNGITTLTSPGYVPTSISLQGNFGRKFKFILNGQSGTEFAASFTTKNSFFRGNKNIDVLSIATGVADAFDKNVKSGYGLTKILESIIESSKLVDEDGNGYTLIFHNLAFDRVQIVKVEDFTINMDQSSNMMWNYNLQMTTLGDARNYYAETKGMKSLKGSSFSQKAIGNVLDQVTRLLNKTI